MNPGPIRNDALDGRDRLFVALWALALLLLYGVSAWLGARQLHAYKAETVKTRLAFLESATIDRAGEPEPSEVVNSAQVTVGVYVNHIGALSRDGSSTQDFDVWFRWHDPALDPGASFQILHAEVLKRQTIASYSAGDEQYARYRIVARLTSPIDPGRFPFGDYPLTIQIEDGVHAVDRLRYVADEADSGMNPRAAPPGIEVTTTLATVKSYVHASALGDPRAVARSHRTHSLLVFAMIASPPSGQLFVKSFQACFAAVAVAFIAFFIRPTYLDPRFGLGVGAIFTATANNIAVLGTIPSTGSFTLTAMVNAAGLGTLLLVLVESAISLYLLDSLGRERLYRLLDGVSFVLLSVGYVSLNVVLVSAAQ